MSKRVLVVGAGFAGAVLARELAEQADIRSLVIDSRNHVGGNCHTEREESTGVMVHRYGPHIFNTNNEVVWKYIHRFGEWIPYINRVKASIKQGIFSLPINLHTINQFYGKRFSPSEARAFVETLGDKTIKEPTTFEEQALRFVGSDLYEAFFKGYTIKQWGCDPSELPASILKRLPIRFNYNDNYYNSRFQAIPREGYTKVVKSILDHPLVETMLSTSWENGMNHEFDHVFFSGPIDAFYNYSEGRLGYRTVFWERHEDLGDFQGNPVINYPEQSVPFTRVHEHKHFAPWEEHEKTAVFTEYSKETDSNDIPYYPKRLVSDKEILSNYRAMATKERRVTFIGRLGSYRYLDMDHVIEDTLEHSKRYLENL